MNKKATLTVMISKNIVKDKNLDAAKIIKELSKEIQGGGGGQPFYATSGGTNISGIEKALVKAKDFLGTN